VRRGKDLDGLCEAENPAEQRDLDAAEPLRLTAAVPVLIERPDGCGRRLRKAELAGDVRAALTVGLLAAFDEQPASLSRSAKKSAERSSSPSWSSSASRIPIRQLRIACPGGCPSVMSSAYESAESTSDRRSCWETAPTLIASAAYA